MNAVVSASPSPACPAAAPSGFSQSRALEHVAVLYSNVQDFTKAVVEFIEAGLARGDRALVMVPAEHVVRVRARFDDVEGVAFEDMTSLGRNPARLIPRIRSFLDHDLTSPARLVIEPIWRGRSHDEIEEATLHESLINLAFAHDHISILCPYDSRLLPLGVLDDCLRTHPSARDGVGSHSPTSYLEPEVMCEAGSWPLSPMPHEAIRIRITRNGLSRIRDLVVQHASDAKLGASRTADLQLAVNEVATNAIVHGAGGAFMYAWVEPGTVVCEVHDQGWFTDLLAGRRRPHLESEGQRGLWMVNQLCDLVQLRSGAEGTTVRLRVEARRSIDLRAT